MAPAPLPGEPWRVEMLGGLRAVRGEQVLTRFRTRKAALLLACLAYYRHRHHSREELAERLWPESDPVASRNRLRQEVAALRRQLEPPGVPAESVLIATRDYLALRPEALRTDVADFEAALRLARHAATPEARADALSRARELYRGELLPGHYDDWVLLERARLAEAQAAAQEQWMATQALAREGRRTPAREAPPAPAEPSSTVRLPALFTAFFGREEELAWLTATLAQAAEGEGNLLTLTGPGGAGKTRLAVEAARGVISSFGGGVYFIPLADRMDPRQVPEAILDYLPRARALHGDACEQVVALLTASGQPTLLVLDNLEHLLAPAFEETDAAGTVRLLRERVPRLTVLATSRKTLGLAGEREFAVQPLRLPALSGVQERLPSHLVGYSSIALFLDRAQSRRPAFGLTDGNAAAVATLCTRLEGLPLAIELAAARIGPLTPAQILGQLDDPLRFLVSPRRDIVARHRSLAETIAWSYRLLSVARQRFFAQLSVFRGGWSAEAAEAICRGPQDEGSVLETLEHLHDSSLVQAEEGRFQMLETLRQFAQEQLSPEEEAALRQRHRAYFQRLAQEAEPHLQGWERDSWMARLEPERDNLRAALEGAIRDGDAAVGLPLAASLLWFWAYRGYVQEGLQCLAGILRASSEPTTARARALHAAGVMAWMRGEYPAALSWLEEAAQVCQGIEDRFSLARVRREQAIVRLYAQDPDGARAAAEEAEALCRAEALPWDIALALANRGYVAYVRGEPAQAYFEESRARFEALADPWWISVALLGLGLVACQEGALAQGRALFEEALAYQREVNEPWGLAEALARVAEASLRQRELETADACSAASVRGFLQLGDQGGLVNPLFVRGEVAAARGLHRRAVLCFAAAQALQARLGGVCPLTLRDASSDQASIARSREALGETAFFAAWAAGGTMALERIVEEALRI